ncbi:MAG TPA: hypothetical protein VKR59_03910 [Terriglobales bacterium]|nr:hypothetical protein [Terriglobales bacterium]
MTKQFAFVVVLACAATMVSAQSSSKRAVPDESKRILPVAHITVGAAYERTPEQMDAFDATMAVSREEKEEPSPRPTMDADVYARLKQQAALAPKTPKPNSGVFSPNSPQTTLVFTGATECDGSSGCWTPPDVAGSVSKANWVSVSNDMVEIHSKSGGLLKLNSLNGFFGYSTESMFDPRVQFDEEYQRWIITADAFAESSTVQYLGVAVSQTSSPTGKWWIYFTNTNGFTGTGSFFDYPQLGISQDAVLITGNVFGTSSFLGAYAFALAKAHIYNGIGWSVPVFKGLDATLAPPHQLDSDQNGYVWFAAANAPGINMYVMDFPSSPGDTGLFGPYAVSGVASWSTPPGSPQPASCAPTGALLDSLDGRFQNTGLENGDIYYQTNTTADFGVATPRYYIISGLLSFTPAVSTWADFYGFGTTSYDWNPSIGTDTAGRIALNWSDTDPTNGIEASMYFADNKTAVISGNNRSTRIYVSPSCYTGVGTSRWGDYSQTTYDFSAATPTFWITNESIPSANFWSTKVAKVVY